MRGAKWMQKEKEGLSTCEALTQLANDNGIDLLVAGSFGRKGEKLWVARGAGVAALPALLLLLKICGLAAGLNMAWICPLAGGRC